MDSSYKIEIQDINHSTPLASIPFSYVKMFPNSQDSRSQHFSIFLLFQKHPKSGEVPICPTAWVTEQDYAPSMGFSSMEW